MTTVRRISKALAAAVGALAGAYGTAYADGAVTSGEWWGIAGATVLAGVVTYLAPKNAEPATEPAAAQ